MRSCDGIVRSRPTLSVDHLIVHSRYRRIKHGAGRRRGLKALSGGKPMRYLALIVAAALAAPLAAAAIEVGQPAPAFSARDADGKPVTLASLRGKTVVLEWTNNGCPFVGHMYSSGVMQRLQRQAAADGLVWLSVISSAPGKQGYLTGAPVPAWNAKVRAASAPGPL